MLQHSQLSEPTGQHIGTNGPVNRMESGRDHSLRPHAATDERLMAFMDTMDSSLLERYFGSPEERSQSVAVGRLASFLLDLSRKSEVRSSMEKVIEQFGSSVEEPSSTTPNVAAKEYLNMESRVQLAFRTYRERFPSTIFSCCKKFCFTTIATDTSQFMLLNELMVIHDYANLLHTEQERIPSLINRRRHGIGTSTAAFRTLPRKERQAADDGNDGTDRENSLQEYAKFVGEVLPFLYGLEDAPSGTKRPQRKLCTRCICCLLGVSRNFLYNRSMRHNIRGGSAEDLSSLIDSAGVRLRQRRRNGDRFGFVSLSNLRDYECGCFVPCFSKAPRWTLASEYNTFRVISRDLKPRHKENRFLLDRMFCNLSNSTTKVCNRALAELYTVSESLIADVRRVLNVMCSQEELFDELTNTDASARYKYNRGHPLNRYSDEVRRKVELHLDLVLRADPAGSNGASICRVYSPEINTQKKLRKILGSVVEEDGAEVILSASTLQRMIMEYLKRRNYSAISFAQSDHNACPNCKTLQYAILQFHHESGTMQRELDHILETPRPFCKDTKERLESLYRRVEAKKFQEEECVKELRTHNERDARIRGMMKRISDYFRYRENRYRSFHLLQGNRGDEEDTSSALPVSWNQFIDRASQTHQDDMTKVDLPHFVISASSDITRWRFNVNAHVSAITNESVVLSYEQGTGPKNASAIVEEILINHLLTCRGESIKIIVSDNAAVGKNWLTTVALPQYMVDQGLCEIAMVVFLENNHGKWLADMLFGQFQTRRRRQTMLGVDDMLAGFEGIKRKNGNIQGFAVNPLSSVDFKEVFSFLGYETKPPSGFGFVSRNTLFSCACTKTAKNHLPVEIMELIGSALPDDPGMVRLSTEPPGSFSQCELEYEDRYFDVPAARFAAIDEQSDRTCTLRHGLDIAPFVVPERFHYSPGGNFVVSARTAEHVGFNGIQFRGLSACPELSNLNSALVRRAWPRGLLKEAASDRDEPIPKSENLKCAPLNWVVRRPVKHFCDSDMDWNARYPPQNLLNAKYGQGPREPYPWVPTASYSEPPFPIIPGTAACQAMKKLAAQHKDIRKHVGMLEVLRAVYEDIGDRDEVSDKWMQRKVTIPTHSALRNFKEELQIYEERENGHPKGVKTVWQMFRTDQEIIAKATSLLSSHDCSELLMQKVRNEKIRNLFEEAAKKPGGLNRYYYLVAKDQERYARELATFKEKKKRFDKDRGIQARS